MSRREMIRNLPVSELPKHVRGDVWLDATGRDWNGLSLCGFTLDPMTSDVCLRRHTLVVYLEGSATMRRRLNGNHVVDHVRPGDLSLKNCSTVGEWDWSEGRLEVAHIYLTPELLQRVAGEMYGPGVGAVRLRDCVRTRDDEIWHIAGTLIREAQCTGPGSHVVATALGRQLAVALLRRHGHVVPSRPPARRFDEDARRHIAEHIGAHLDSDLSVAALAREMGWSTDHFSRLFRSTFHCAPRQHVLRMRVERARRLLLESTRTLGEIAAETGFADQSHLTRCFKQAHGLPPKAWRKLAQTPPDLE